MTEQQATNGQTWAREIVTRHEGALLRYARRLTGSADLARDVVQETLLRCWGDERWRENGHAGASRDAPGTAGATGASPASDHLANWLFAVCRSRAIDALRKERQMTRVAELEATETAVSAAVLPSIDPAPSAVAETRDSAAAAMRVLETLPLRQQEVVVLKFQGGLSYQQIAEVTGLSVSNVGFLMHVALKTLRQRLITPAE